MNKNLFLHDILLFLLRIYFNFCYNFLKVTNLIILILIFGDLTTFSFSLAIMCAWNKGKALWVYLQLTQSLYTWLKTVSLSFFILKIMQASQDIVCATTLIPQISLSQKTQFILALIPKSCLLYILSCYKF